MLQALSIARSASELAAQQPALHAQGAVGLLAEAPEQVVAAACNALHIAAAARTLPTTEAASRTLWQALTCTGMLALPACWVLGRVTALQLPAMVAQVKGAHRDGDAGYLGRDVPLPCSLQCACTKRPHSPVPDTVLLHLWPALLKYGRPFSDLMLAVAAAAKTATTHLRAPRQAAVQASSLPVWICMSEALLVAAEALDGMLARGSVPGVFSAEVAAMSSILPGLAVAMLCSSTPSTGQHDLGDSWAGALSCARDPIHKAFCTISSSLSLQESVQGDLAELVLLRVGLQAAALHQQQAGRSCSIAADPVAAAGLSSSSSSIGGSSSQSRPAPPLRLAVPPFH